MKKTGVGRRPRIKNVPVLFDAGTWHTTRLDPEQTSEQGANQPVVEYPPKGEAEKRLDRAGRAYEFYIPPPSEIETTFRHSGWLQARARVESALRDAGASAGRLERFAKCGSDCIVQVSEDGKQTRVRGCFCGDRFCVPCSTARASRARRKLMRMSEGQELRFLTLTLRATSDPLVEVLAHLRKSFTRLRRSGLWRRSVDRGAAFVEITRGRTGTHWHVHLHAIVGGKYIPKPILSETWKWASGGSFIVDVQGISGKEDVLRYVTKYAAKGFDPSVLQRREHLIECMVALRGSRMMMTFGAWYAAGGEDEPEPEQKWKTIARLDHVLMSARRGEKWAIGVCNALRCKATLLEQTTLDDDDGEIVQNVIMACKSAPARRDRAST